MMYEALSYNTRSFQNVRFLRKRKKLFITNLVLVPMIVGITRKDKVSKLF